MQPYLTLLFVFLSIGAQAQLSHGGSPMEWEHSMEDRNNIPEAALDALNVDSALAMIDTAGAPGGYRFGMQRTLDVDLIAQGQWTDLADGGRVCRLTLRSPGAVMMSVQFSRFQPSWGARLFLYDEAGTMFLGAFTVQNQQPDGLFATAFLPGDAVTIEYQEPAGAAPAQLQVGHITHAWQSIFSPGSAGSRDFDPGYQSSPCQTNVVCPEASDWQDQNRSVIWFVMPSGIGCNGTLLNNTMEDGTPYVLIANHCYQATESQWIFYFNYQSPTCIGDVGPTTQTLTGSVRRAVDYYKDFCLMELNDVPPQSFGAYYAGWDRGGAAPQSGANISNPLSDVKKINFYNSPATTSSTQNPTVECWRMNWTSGVLEPGASGSPLFDQNKRVVAHMVDGRQTCATSTTVPAYGSKFSVNWDGPSASSRLRDWLDPENNVMSLNGYDPNTSHTVITVKLKAMLQGPFIEAQGLMTSALNDAGILPLTEPYSAKGYIHQGGGGGESTTQSVLNITGSTRVVDWVVVELRDKNNPANVLSTRSALLRRDGTIVDLDGTSDVVFQALDPDQYYVAIRHRNHLGIMTAAAQPLSATATMINFTNGSLDVRGGSDATISLNNVRCLWGGDVDMDGTVRYTGQFNDRDPILVLMGGGLPTSQFDGYVSEDVNLDGVVRYTGNGNDRDLQLLNLNGFQTGELAGHLP